MTNQQSNLLSKVGAEAKALLAKDGEYVQLDILNTTYGTTITQQDIDSVPSFKNAGLTVAQFQAAVYILKLCHVQINSDLPAMVAMANL